MCLSCLNKKQTLIILTILIIFSFIFENLNPQNKQSNKNNEKITPSVQINQSFSATASGEIFKVKKVIDGDTIVLENDKKVRYIGVDTPELHNPRKGVECFAKQAYLENKRLVEKKMVKLEKDVSFVDKYNRLLAYVYLIDNESSKSSLFVNEYLVKEGFAYAVTYPPDVKYAQLLLKAQEYAQKNNKGLWQSCPLPKK